MDRRAISLVSEFTQEVLHGDWDAWKNFDFKSLSDSEKFGCPGRNFDCDDTNIMRAVYVVLWGDVLPYLYMDNFGYCKQYRGDTVNTFHTMFGREIPGRPGFFAGLEKYKPDDGLREKVRNFGKLCSNIGNYTVLPNYFACQTSLNCYRGTNEWHDFFDRFLIELHHVLSGAEKQDETLRELVRVNDFCFRKFRGENGVKELIRVMFLEDYCSSSGVPGEVFPMNYHWRDLREREKYFCDSGVYLEKTARIITGRAEKMAAALKSKVCAAL